MKCPICDTEIDDSEISASFAAHDPDAIDILVRCPNPKCNYVGNTFVSKDELVSLDSLLVQQKEGK